MKLRVNVSQKTLLIIGSCCILAMAILATRWILELQRTDNYCKVQGTVESIDKKTDYGVKNDSKTSKLNYLTCVYQVDGKEYECRYRTFFTLGKKVNSAITIYFDPYNPEKVRNRFLIECCFCGIVFLAVFTIFIAAAIRQT